MKHVVEPIRSKKEITDIEVYLKKKNFRNMVIWVFGINTGLRVSDILGLNISDVKDRTIVELKEKKTGKNKQIFLNQKLQRILKNFILGREDEEPLFVGQKFFHRLDRSQVYRALNEACKEVGVTENHIGTHTMRKTFGYHHYQKFKDVVLLQKIFNHSSPQITLRYIGINQDEINRSYQNFEL